MSAPKPKTPSTPFKKRLTNSLRNGIGKSDIERNDAGEDQPIGRFYRPSYANANEIEVESRAEVCLHVMDCYGPGGSHEHKPEAAEMYSIAHAAAISWLSR